MHIVPGLELSGKAVYQKLASLHQYNKGRVTLILSKKGGRQIGIKRVVNLHAGQSHESHVWGITDRLPLRQYQ